MSVIVGVVRAGGVLLATDRAVTNPHKQVAAGTPHLWPDRTKLIRTTRGVAVGMAGVIGAGSTGPAADLLAAAAARVADARRAAEAATAVRDLLNEVAIDLRRYAGEAQELDTGDMPQVAPTVALVAGPSPTGPELIAVALPAVGPALEWVVPAPGLALGPTLAEHVELGAATQAAAHEPLPAALERLDGAIATVAVQHYKHVSADWDHVLVDATGAGPITPHERQRLSLRPGV